MARGIIFNIQRYTVHDGPGIRTTVFLKGCSLRCGWCHNPESWREQPEIIFDSRKCLQCYQCISLCPHQAITIRNHYPYTEKQRCRACGSCITVCPGQAREFVGKAVTTHEVGQEIRKDLVFYQESGGGVTFSGGEPLMQIDFLEELLSSCQEEGIHTAVDTCGYAPWSHFERLIPLVDLWLYDLKVMDESRHLQYTGVSNQRILENLTSLTRKTDQITMRIPVIPGVTDSSDEAQQMATLAHTLGIKKVSLLPFHRMGSEKYERLGMDHKAAAFTVPSEEYISELRQIFDRQNLQVTTGG